MLYAIVIGAIVFGFFFWWMQKYPHGYLNRNKDQGDKKPDEKK